MPGMDGMELLRKIRAAHLHTEVVLMTAHGSEKIAVQAMKEGAHDYLVKPFENEEVRVIVQKALEAHSLKRENLLLREKLEEQYTFRSILGKSPAMHTLFNVIGKVAPTDASILITGESGTGKELVANAVHFGSPRKKGLFVAVNCAALSRELVESELFGHEKGAFTGAASSRKGKFELAHGGTLFLDEVGDMHPETQAKVLRALQEKNFERVGGTQTIRVDVRIIAATHRNLDEAIRDGSFREDLYYRLNVVQAHIPPLRERKEDILLLFNHFLQACSEELGKPPPACPAETLRCIMEYPWPGNVRELRNLVEQLVILCGEEIRITDLPSSLQEASGIPSPLLSFKEAKQKVVQEFEKNFIVSALQRNNGNITRTAEEMGMYRQNLQQKIKEYGIRSGREKD